MDGELFQTTTDQMSRITRTLSEEGSNRDATPRSRLQNLNLPSGSHLLRGAILVNNSSGQGPPGQRTTQKREARNAAAISSTVWLRMLERPTMAPAETVGPLRVESDEL
jgi:hypothetical protein